MNHHNNLQKNKKYYKIKLKNITLQKLFNQA